MCHMITLEEICTNQLHEVSDSESTQSQKSVSDRKQEGALKARNLSSEFAVEWKKREHVPLLHSVWGLSCALDRTFRP